MTNDIKLQQELKEKLLTINQSSIGVQIYPPGKRLGDFEGADILYPLTPKNFALFKLHINNGVPIFPEYTEFLFLYKYIFITSSMGLTLYDKSDGSLDATGSTCKLLFEKTGLKGFDFIFDEVAKTHQLVIYLNDGNYFRSVAFTPSEKIPEDFISVLNKSLEINKWL